MGEEGQKGTLLSAGKLTELIMGNAGLQMIGKEQFCGSGISARKAVLERLHATKMFLETQIGENKIWGIRPGCADMYSRGRN